MSVEDRVRRTLTTTASSVAPPTVDVAMVRANALRVRRRRQAASAMVAAVGVVFAVLLLPRLVVSGDDPGPSGPPPTRQVGVPAPSGAVWFDDAGLHHGKTVLHVSSVMPPISLALVKDGAVYAEPGTLDIWYQPWSGKGRVIGHGTAGNLGPLGPGADPRGTTAAWFDGDSLVMYDTSQGVEIARKPQPGRLPGFYRENQMGTRINYVDQDRVVWSSGAVYSFDRRSGVVSDLGRVAQDKPYPVDVFPGLVATNANNGERPDAVLTQDDGTLLYRGGAGFDPVRFSPDGRYLAVIEEPTEAGSYDPVVVNTQTGEPVVPVKSLTYPWVGWGYGDTLMYLQQSRSDPQGQRGRLLTYDAVTGDTELVESRGTVVLPQN